MLLNEATHPSSEGEYKLGFLSGNLARYVSRLHLIAGYGGKLESLPMGLLTTSPKALKYSSTEFKQLEIPNPRFLDIDQAVLSPIDTYHTH